MKKYFLFSIILLASCGKFSKRLNQQVDIDRGKRISEKFYDYVKSGDFVSADGLCGGVIKPGEATDLLKGLNITHGTLQSTSFVSGGSDVTERQDSITGEIDLKYTAVYANVTKNEDFVLKFVKDSLRIVGYHSVVPGSDSAK
ncbi:MAG TPA: hypothetical protein VL651_01975 [Bacteroidia bacterium]|jgi:hypothetical protein|nr:hypothetical protein [Bacteroidia bacterium]